MAGWHRLWLECAADHSLVCVHAHLYLVAVAGCHRQFVERQTDIQRCGIVLRHSVLRVCQHEGMALRSAVERSAAGIDPTYRLRCHITVCCTGFQLQSQVYILVVVASPCRFHHHGVGGQIGCQCRAVYHLRHQHPANRHRANSCLPCRFRQLGGIIIEQRTAHGVWR